MKKFLLSLVFASFYFLSHAQLKFNEFYVDPQTNSTVRQEYFELINTNAGGSPASIVNTNDYVLVTYFVRKLANGTSETGLYVLDLPDFSVSGGGLFLGGSANPIEYQYTNGSPFINATPNYVWTNALKYTLNGSTYTQAPIPTAEMNDIFLRSSTDYVMMLFKYTGVQTLHLEHAFLGGENRSTIPSFIYNLPTISNIDYYSTGNVHHTNGRIVFNTYTNFGTENVVDNVPSSSGTDNGYFFNCSAQSGNKWQKANNPPDHTPGRANGLGATQTPLTVATSCALSPAPNPNNTRTLKFTITDGDASAFPVKVRLYVDNDGSFDLSPGDNEITTSAISAQKGVEYSIIITGYNAIEGFILVLEGTACSFDQQILVFCPPNIVTPVTLGLFNASRNGSNVQLSWETLSESHNKGFYIQRKNGSAWENLSFVESKAPNGNSAKTLAYTFNEVNTNKTMTQYRLLQVDRDGKERYSDIRSVRGLEQLNSVIVYPSPSYDGKVNVVFDDATGTRNIIVSDMTGRIIQQFRNITSSSLQIQNLMTGLYNIKILNMQTGQQNVQRVAVANK